MFSNLFNSSEGLFKKSFRFQLLAALNINIITLCHGVGLGWFAPMVLSLQTDESPVAFSVNTDQASWIGSLLSLGGLLGNIIFCNLMDRIGRKASIYCLAVPHMCLWVMIYFANEVQYLYAARILGGITGGGCYIVLPIFIAEIADPSIRGRLTSLFILSVNIGMLMGFIMSSHLNYYVIPCIMIVMPVIYISLALFFPETPQHLLRRGRDDEAKASLKFYRNYNSSCDTKEEFQKFNTHFNELKEAVQSKKSDNGVSIKDFCTKRSLKALCTGLVLMILNQFSGSFAIMNYMSVIFAATGSQMDPNTNTIIIGVVQIFGTYTATILVDRCGRKILMILSSSGMGLGLAALGMYAFFTEEEHLDMSNFNWLPLVLMAFIIFIANIGIISVTFVVLVEILPTKIRSVGSSICLCLLSVIAFCMLRIFPLFIESFGLSATMWFCATICAFGLFYISVFLTETKGKSIDTDEDS